MTRQEFLDRNDIISVLEARGVSVKGSGDQRMCKCPLHDDGTASFSISISKKLWKCHGGCGGGSVIDLLAKLEGKSIPQILKDSGVTNRHEPSSPASSIEKVYSYQNELGYEVYQVVRMIPKSFRQRHQVDGAWVWNMEGVTRVLYNLPAVTKAQEVWIVEGEKDADNLNKLGLVATTNVGGGGKWLDAYTESLSGKDIVICGDNDPTGQKHVEVVFESLSGKVHSARTVSLPKTFKDVSDFIASFSNSEKAKTELDRFKSDSIQFFKGIKVPVFSMAELEARYKKHVASLNESSLSLGKWLPTLGLNVRHLVPGDLVLIIGDTGIGKTAILQNIAYHAKPIPTVLFEMELPAEVLYERFIALHQKMPAKEVQSAYQINDSLGEKVLDYHFPGLFICDESGLTVDQLENYIIKSQLKIGTNPKLVLVDYVQLLKGVGKRYERVSDHAEQLKVLAKRTGVILIISSQVARPSDDDPTIHLHSAKDSGSLENSASLVLGAWRDGSDPSLLYIKILKNTKGNALSDPIKCNYIGEQSLITERYVNVT